ncbi:Fc.00g019200.m01.CDS01 [Cosmosporella sp. VM-42]
MVNFNIGRFVRQRVMTSFLEHTRADGMNQAYDYTILGDTDPDDLHEEAEELKEGLGNNSRWR